MSSRFAMMAAAIGLSVFAGESNAQTIDTRTGATPTTIGWAGLTQNAARGQSFTAPLDLFLQTASLWMSTSSATTPLTFVGILQGWNNATKQVTGPVLFQSAAQSITTYAFFARILSGNGVMYADDLVNSYAGGDAIADSPYGSGSPNFTTGYDGGFVATYTTTPPVTATPEPASMALMATGIASVAGWARRRKKQALDA
jgi:hypothetical protein